MLCTGLGSYKVIFMTARQTTTGRKAGKESTMDFTNIPAGCLEEGTETSLGIIEHVSLTAYLIDGRWVPFARVHGAPKRAQALAISQDWVDALSEEDAAIMRRQSEANIRALFV